MFKIIVYFKKIYNSCLNDFFTGAVSSFHQWKISQQNHAKYETIVILFLNASVAQIEFPFSFEIDNKIQ